MFDAMSKRPWNLLLAALPILFWAASAPAQDAALASAVDAYDPSLSLPEEAELVQWADFTGDGRPDVAAILRSPAGSALVVFNATAEGFQPHPLFKDLPSVPVELRLVLPGVHRVLTPRRSIELSEPAVELVFRGRSSAIYVWRGGRYQVFPSENYH